MSTLDVSEKAVETARASAIDTATQLLSQMTLPEKIAQMTQVEKNSLTPEDVAKHGIGSVLSGGGGNPEPNNPEAWLLMVQGFQRAALQSRLKIPLLYGSDAVHGHNNMVGATILPHNIGLGATRDPDLVRRVGRVTALETSAVGVRWDFAPAVSVPQDIRWGRAFEGYSQDTAIVSELATAFLTGLQGDSLSEPTSVLACIKHYVADGATTWGTSKRVDRAALQIDQTLANANLDASFSKLVTEGAWQLDQGSSDIDEAELRRVHLPPYEAAVKAGALSVMASYSSWDGLKLHAHRYLLTEVLKNELGFEGFVVTDWEGVDQISPDDFYDSVVQAVNAGIDMVMVPFRFERFMETLQKAVSQGDVPLARIDDAASRILYVKARSGMFEETGTPPGLLEKVGSAEHRKVAKEAVRKSLVLLKNESALPLEKKQALLLAGRAANDVGYQCGGWTVTWMGGPGPIAPGTTLLEGVKAVAPDAEISYRTDGDFDTRAEVGLVVLAEEPYAEGMGDKEDLHLRPEQITLLERVRSHCDKLVLVLFSGRPLILTEQLPLCDALVAAWLPGTEGQGVAEVLFGDYNFGGKLPFVWPASMAQVPLSRLENQEPLFPLGYGLTTDLTMEQTR